MIIQHPPLLAQIGKFIDSPSIQGPLQTSKAVYLSNLGLFKAVGILLTVFFVSCTIFFILKTGWLATRVDRFEDVLLKSDMPKRRAIKAWRNIQKHFFAGDDNNLKLAIIEADNTLNEALRLAGFKGENLGDRLKMIDESKLPGVQQIWEAHKLRNKIVHETNYKLNRNTAEKALAIYEATLSDLGLLD